MDCLHWISTPLLLRVMTFLQHANAMLFSEYPKTLQAYIVIFNLIKMLQQYRSLTFLDISPQYPHIVISVRSRVFMVKSQWMHDFMCHVTRIPTAISKRYGLLASSTTNIRFTEITVNINQWYLNEATLYHLDHLCSQSPLADRGISIRGVPFCFHIFRKRTFLLYSPNCNNCNVMWMWLEVTHYSQSLNYNFAGLNWSLVV